MDKFVVELSRNFSIEGTLDKESGKIIFSNNGKLLIVEKEEEIAKNILHFRISQSITNLYKQFLILLEDIQEEYNGSMSRLLESLPEEERVKVLQANFFDEEKFQYLRKKVLGAGNDTVRNIESELENYQFLFNIEERSMDEKH